MAVRMLTLSSHLSRSKNNKLSNFTVNKVIVLIQINSCCGGLKVVVVFMREHRHCVFIIFTKLPT